jgi:phospholipid/cholesterol/gamma-HCH transport system permease protein
MTINNEVDALHVMGVNPVRYLVVPSLLALMLMLPALALWSNFVGLLGAGIFITTDLGMTMAAYVQDTLDYIDVEDVFHGLGKALIFGVLIALVGVVDGTSVKGGAEGVGRVTTQAVVHGISAIVLTDMIFTYVTTR